VKQLLQKAALCRAKPITAFVGVQHLVQFIPYSVSTRNDGPDLQPIAVQDQFILSHEIVASYHQMRFDDEIQFPQDFAYALGAFNFDLPLGVAQLHEHVNRS
jgi:hypothetical protein